MMHPEMKQRLEEHGIVAQAVQYWPSKGHYVADFYNKRMKEPVKSAEEYGKLIKAALPGADVTETYNTRAEWRPNQPVVWAVVTFRYDVE